MARKPLKATECRCGSSDFGVEGVVAYVRSYHSRVDDWSPSKIEWELDYPTGARCLRCDREASALLVRSGSLSGFYNVLAAELEGPSKRRYLVDFEFISGEFGQPFSKVFEAPHPETLERRVEKYLRDYYDGGSRREGRTWFYMNDQVAVKLCGWRQIVDPAELVRELQASGRG